MFNEPVSVIQYAGIFILFAAICILGKYDNSIKGKITPEKLVLYLLVFLSSGLNNLSPKMFTHYIENPNIVLFNFLTFLFSAITLSVTALVIKKPDAEKKAFPFKMLIPYIVVMSIALFLNTFFITKATQSMPSVIMFPLYSGLALILSSLMGAVLFEEKLTIRSVCGILLAIASLIIINGLD